MTTYEPLTFSHLLRFNPVNFDSLTETYSTSFYGEYLTRWTPYQMAVSHGPTGLMCGYSLNKHEGEKEMEHAHVSAVTVAPFARRLGLAETLMLLLEESTLAMHPQSYFIDLFVRQSNLVAQQMYEKLGYVVYRRVLGYYQGPPPAAAAVSALGPSTGISPAATLASSEDALDMRKALPRNAVRSVSAIIPLTKPIRPQDLEFM